MDSYPGVTGRRDEKEVSLRRYPATATRRTAIQDDGLGLRRELDPHQTPAVPLSIRTIVTAKLASSSKFPYAIQCLSRYTLDFII